MNLQVHISKRLSEILYLILVLLCMHTYCMHDMQDIHKEVQVNQKRLLDKLLPDGLLAREGANSTSGDVAINGTTGTNITNGTETKEKKKELTFWSGFIDSLAMIFFVEFGDRTFMITVLFTMKHDKFKVFVPAIFTMMGMHLISVCFGTLFPLLFSRNAIVYFSIVLFIFFGCWMIYEAYHMVPKKSEDKVAELANELLNKKSSGTGEDANSGIVKPENASAISGEKALEKVAVENMNSGKAPEVLLPEEKQKDNKLTYWCANPYLHLVVMLFLADWGDRCQISAIVLTATHNIYGVAMGGALGMAICVCLAVIAGAFLANRLNEKTTTYIAGVLFIVFAFQSIFMLE